MRFGTAAASHAQKDDPWRDLTRLRRELHRHAELPGQEEATAQMIADWLYALDPDAVFLRIAGHGLACVFEGAAPGKTILFRAELRAHPIAEGNYFQHRSIHEHRSHAAGHDGEMAILAGLATRLAEQRPFTGRVVLLFQGGAPGGDGAARTLGDETFRKLRPDLVFALRNLPQRPLGEFLIRDGTQYCASVGLVARLGGKATSAASPEYGHSPAVAVGEILSQLQDLPVPSDEPDLFRCTTLTHARLGDVTLDIAPGYAEVMAAMRAETDEALARLAERASLAVRGIARARGLSCEVHWRERFAAAVNDRLAVERLRSVAEALQIPAGELPAPLRSSDDFSEFTKRFRGAIFGLGAGERHPPLFSADYDFPDKLLPIGVEFTARLVEELLNSEERR